jgi:hypothetical protein
MLARLITKLVEALVGTVLRGLGGLPVYRRQDDPALMHLNERTFDAAIEALLRREAVQIYPEGQSHSEPSLAPLRTGAARIALQAEARSGWRLGLRIQPVGLTYTRKHLFRGRVVAAFGTPMTVTRHREAFEADEREAARSLTEEIRVALESLTLNLDHPDDRDLIEVAERLYSREKRLVPWGKRAPMAERLPRLQRFAEGLAWLRANDPEGHRRLRRAVSRYLRLLTLVGASERDVPPRYRMGPVVQWVVTRTLGLGLLLPPALVGVAAWAPPYLLTRRVVPRFRPQLDQVATYKLATGILAFPAWLALATTLAWLLWGWRWGVGLLVGAPLAGLAAIAWRERADRAREDLRVFMRVFRDRRARDRLAAQRARLVEAFDAAALAIEADRAAG